jgi:tetratricopeptide (TPR) repeat protein
MKKQLLLLLVLMANFSLSATPAQDLVISASEAYKKNDFSKAILLYQQVINEYELQAPEVYFNLGNAYFKVTDYPSAILYYERAAKLAPADEDIQFNLNLANQKTEDRIEAIPEMFYIRWFQAIRNMGDQDFWAIVFLLLFSISIALFILFIQTTSSSKKKLGFYGFIGVFTLSLIVFSLAMSMHTKQTNHHEAIVFSGSVSVKSSPVESGTGLFVIHAGTKVKITDELGDWLRIRIADGNEGWILASDLERI